MSEEEDIEIRNQTSDDHDIMAEAEGILAEAEKDHPKKRSSKKLRGLDQLDNLENIIQSYV